ncbi:Arfaptin domain/BAR domain containing protein [Trema orientale]|uniref:Arfaptin domain/BAR domain containing protein n=1 Tax=Trema orientale TaxID=63057 RepID=A0A2P5FCD8_TREOI|nr:Arfaptin domain/BAR domain containing protein [Trema orientale]
MGLGQSGKKIVEGGQKRELGREMSGEVEIESDPLAHPPAWSNFKGLREMKSPLDKLRKFALYKNDSKDKRNLSSTQLDDLAQAAKDMQDMRDCYDSLLSAAAATANSAYEFSESLREMGTCLLEKTALHDDEESGRVLLMLGKAQFELQKLVDSYRAHIFLTITNPSESLLNELRTVEEMKRQCDEKRSVYQYMVAQQKEKGKPKSGKSESFSSQHLRAAHDAYDEEATLCVFRLKSLKQGQSRSLLTQAARHHAAQLNFFRKGLKSLEAIEPHVRLVTEQQHIEYQFSGLEDYDGEDGEEDGGNGNDANEYRELSFDYRPNKQGLDAGPTSRNSMEGQGKSTLESFKTLFDIPSRSLQMDEDGNSSPQASKVEIAEMNLDKNQGDLKVSREPRVSSHSAPIFAEKKFDPAEKARQLLPLSTRKSNTYVLPTPTDAKGVVSSRNSSSALHTKPSGHTHNLWHSSPLEEKRPEKDIGDSTMAGLNTSKAPLVLKENSSRTSTQLPPPLAEGLALPQLDTVNTSDAKKIKRQAFSGPLTSKPSSTKPVSSASGPIASTEFLQLASGMISRSQMPQTSSSPKVSPSASPPLASSPRISELHELPRPPGSLAVKASRSPGLIGHSAPLVLRNQELNATNRINIASPLPTPPLFVPRSFSIPSSSQREMALHVAKHFESPHGPNKAEDVASPPLTPVSLSNISQVPTVSGVTSQSSPIQVDAGGS